MKRKIVTCTSFRIGLYTDEVPYSSEHHPVNDSLSFAPTDFSSLQGLYQKAETLYTMGDFEFALVFYHRGHKLRPELQKFRLGIQKAQEAIDNCVGSKM